jgi:hypothetical protein
VNASEETPAWQQKLKADVGENPARFLDRRIPNPPPQNSMFRARLEGIDRLAVIGAWEAAERRLASEQDRRPRDHVLRLLEKRREYLQEHGERDLPTMTPDERREQSRKLYDRVTDKKASNQMEHGPLSATQKLNQMRADGGEQE